MFKLSDDVIFIIFEELQDDKNILFSCLTVNKVWCKIILPILWKNPWKTLKKKQDKLLLNIILSHLSDEKKMELELDSLTDLYRKPLFDYISFCRHLNFNKIERMIKSFQEKSKLSIIENEIINLFVNENRYYTHLYISYQFAYQLHLFPGAKSCFSRIQYLNCSTSIKNELSDGLIKLCKSIKVLDLFIEALNNNDGIIRLIRGQRNLSKICLTTHSYSDVYFCIALENSLIEHVNTVQYFKLTKRPSTKIISSFVNLRGLEVSGCLNDVLEWNYLDDVSLPYLEILRVSKIPFNALISLIESTNGLLTEIKTNTILNVNVLNDERIITKVIHQKCPKLQYLKIMLTHNDNNLSEFESLLIKCHYLDGLFITGNVGFDWDELFGVLIKSSPINLFKFKFSDSPSLESLKLFFDNWKGRRPLLLQFGHIENVEDLMEEYKARGIVKKFNNNVSFGEGFEGFEWI
ncbi:hypothetical protein RhiirB3_525417 [Rhizophagus irregularis]|nr:hypothetical protein RhiirB3_525417 [Rhizophagus irregularis]